MGERKKKKQETPEEKANREIVEGIATNLAELSRAVRSFLNGPLKRRAIVVLLAHSSQMHQNKVEAVLKALEDMEGEWINKK